MAIKTDGTLWGWGYNLQGHLGMHSPVAQAAKVSSPVQVGSDTNWSDVHLTSYYGATGLKTDGTLWAWGFNNWGQLGQNNKVAYSSPVQIPGTNWDEWNINYYTSVATKTDGTLWAWGFGSKGQLGLNQSGNAANLSSPTQIPGTTWHIARGGLLSIIATKQI